MRAGCPCDEASCRVINLVKLDRQRPPPTHTHSYPQPPRDNPTRTAPGVNLCSRDSSAALAAALIIPRKAGSKNTVGGRESEDGQPP